MIKFEIIKSALKVEKCQFIIDPFKIKETDSTDEAEDFDDEEESPGEKEKTAKVGSTAELVCSMIDMINSEAVPVLLEKVIEPRIFEYGQSDNEYVPFYESKSNLLLNCMGLSLMQSQFRYRFEENRFTINSEMKHKQPHMGNECYIRKMIQDQDIDYKFDSMTEDEKAENMIKIEKRMDFNYQLRTHDYEYILHRFDKFFEHVQFRQNQIATYFT